MAEFAIVSENCLNYDKFLSMREKGEILFKNMRFSKNREIMVA